MKALLLQSFITEFELDLDTKILKGFQQKSIKKYQSTYGQIRYPGRFSVNVFSFTFILHDIIELCVT